MDSISISRLNTLHPLIRQRAFEDYTFINKHILGKGLRLRITHAYRFPEEQDELYAQGRTKFGKIVTWVKGLNSFHAHGLAIDIVMMYDKNGDGKFEEVSWDLNKDFDKNGVYDWYEVAGYLKKRGWEWGNEWKVKDSPHFQITLGKTTKQLIKLVENKQVITEMINNRLYTFPKIG